MEAGLTDTLHDTEWLVELVKDVTEPPKKPGPKAVALLTTGKTLP